jgi:hypothetical protein
MIAVIILTDAPNMKTADRFIKEYMKTADRFIKE